jgi:hypothetical protein
MNLSINKPLVIAALLASANWASAESLGNAMLTFRVEPTGTVAASGPYDSSVRLHATSVQALGSWGQHGQMDSVPFVSECIVQNGVTSVKTAKAQSGVVVQFMPQRDDRGNLLLHVKATISRIVSIAKDRNAVCEIDRPKIASVETEQVLPAEPGGAFRPIKFDLGGAEYVLSITAIGQSASK